mmetsp:Transcript_7503/g.11357  ORF Transcript_7503/g.11357 Transcript_7503/m.11357 type:complete len:474 (+) Transcript_7503:3-1424(+)
MAEKKKGESRGMAAQRVPVTIISGFLGSGKTTLLKHLLENTEKYKIALIVNDMAELNIDAELVKRKGGEMSTMQGEDGKMVELDNGCICCSLKPNMVKEVARLSKMKRFDYIVIESSGICEPLPIAEAFYEEDVDEEKEKTDLTTGKAIDMLGDLARIDTMVTVVDATRFMEYINSLKSLIEHYGKAKIQDNEDGKRSIAELLVDQVEFANVILVNKIDLIQSATDLKKVKEIVKVLNPSAQLKTTKYCKISPKDVLSTGLFNLEDSQTGAGWAKALKNKESKKSEEKKASNHAHGHSHGHSHGPSHGHSHGHKSSHKHRDHYGITSFIYRRRKPFHPERLYKLLSANKGIEGSLRSKGFCWLASRNDCSIEWNMAGKICALDNGGLWFAETDFKENLKNEPQILEQILADFQEPWGDRRIELVMIGIAMDKKAIEASLDSCLLTESEMKDGLKSWEKYDDKFDPFEEEEDNE